MEEMNGKELGGEEIEIVLAKPPDKKRKERQAARQTTRGGGWVNHMIDGASANDYFSNQLLWWLMEF